MKKTTIFIVTALAWSSGGFVGTSAGADLQGTGTTSQPPSQPPGAEAGACNKGDRGDRGDRGGRGGRCDQGAAGGAEQRGKFRAAFEKARDDQRVVAARAEIKGAMEALRQTMSQALVAQDPSLQPTVAQLDQKMQEFRRQHEERMAKRDQAGPGDRPGGPGRFLEGRQFGAGHGGPGGRGEAGGPGSPGGRGSPGGAPGFADGPFGGRLMADLPEAEREKLKNAHAKVQDQSDVKAARERVESAGRTLREAMRSAMIAADPSLASEIDQFQQRREQRFERRRDGGRPGKGGSGGDSGGGGGGGEG